MIKWEAKIVTSKDDGGTIRITCDGTSRNGASEDGLKSFISGKFYCDESEITITKWDQQ